MRFKEEAYEHWKWTEGLLHAMDHYDQDVVEVMRYLYTTAMVHGYKHGVEDAQNGKAFTDGHKVWDTPQEGRLLGDYDGEDDLTS